MTQTSTQDRSAADRPIPRPGILDITPYVPGKSKAEGIAAPVKLSGNENVLGCSPLAKAAFIAAADRLNVYPDGRAFLTQQLGGLGLEVTPSGGNYILVRLPTTPGRTAREGEAFLASRGYLVRGVAAYGLPEHLRLTIGLEEHNRALVDLLAEFLGAGR